MAKVSVRWNFRAPEGSADTHFSIMRGSKSNLIIRQEVAEHFKPVLYIQSTGSQEFETLLEAAINNEVAAEFPGTTFKKINEDTWKIDIPEAFKIGHEAHFAQVTQNYLKYLESGQLPKWEIPNMVAKYFTTTAALEMAKPK